MSRDDADRTAHPQPLAVRRLERKLRQLDPENLADANEYVDWLLDAQVDYQRRWGARQGESPNVSAFPAAG